MSQTHAVMARPVARATEAAVAPARLTRRAPVARIEANAPRSAQGAGPVTLSAAQPVLQRKLSVGRADDPCEREADAVAERIVRTLEPGISSGGAAVQRKCEACAQEDGEIRRRANGDAASAGGAAPSIVQDVLRSPGEPLDRSARGYFEPRFGQAFNAIRIHADERAARSAQAVDAQAYTVGHHIVFNAGRYAPSTEAGNRLLAHELTHAVQQRAAPADTLQRSFLGFFRNIGRAFQSAFGTESGYDDVTLTTYLGVLDTTGDIEDDYDSDNKARAVVNAWKKGGSPYVLTEQRKALLIRELLKGATGDDDEVAILEVLERSYNFELSYIFGAGGVTVAKLDSDFHGNEHIRLKDFFDRRFENGFEGVKRGEMGLQQAGLPAEVGAQIGGGIDLLFEGETDWNVACVLGILCSEDKAVVTELPKLTVRRANSVVEVYWEFDGSTWNKLERQRGAFSRAEEKVIGLKRALPCGRAATTIVHEVRHQAQASTMTTVEKEKDAYTFTEEWAIKRGMPAFRDDFRTRKEKTQQIVPDLPAIGQYVEGRYSGGTGTAGDQITGHGADGQTEITHPDGSSDTRPPQKGDSHQDFPATKANLSSLPKIDPKEWVCPPVPGQKSP